MLAKPNDAALSDAPGFWPVLANVHAAVPRPEGIARKIAMPVKS